LRRTVHPTTAGVWYWYLPFENHSGQASLDWVGESFPATINQRLVSAGLSDHHARRPSSLPWIISPAAGLQAIARNHNPYRPNVGRGLCCRRQLHYSRTAPDLHIEIQAQVLKMSALKLSSPITDSAPLKPSARSENGVAWNLARQMDPATMSRSRHFYGICGN